jgi:hypothetical protein
MLRRFYQHLKDEDNPMTASERSKILNMIEEGKITPEEGLRLMQVLGEDPVEDRDEPASAPNPTPIEDRPAPERDPAIRATASKARALWMIPVWIGVAITVFGGWVMYSNMHPSGISAWFYCLGFPIFLLGVLITTLGVSSRRISKTDHVWFSTAVAPDILVHA